MIIRVGEGQTPSGKILDRGTKWFNYSKRKSKYIVREEWKDMRNEAIEYALSTNRNIYVSIGNRAYFKVTSEQLMNM